MATRFAALALVGLLVLCACGAAKQSSTRPSELTDLIAFTRSQTYGETIPIGIFVVRPDGSGERRVTPLGSWFKAPAWSPDGTRLAYVDGGQFGLYTVTLDGKPRKLVTKSGSKASAIAWSPDGKLIALTVDLGPHLAPPTAALVEADGGPLQHLVVRDAPEGSRDSIVYGLPAWSPDSRRLAYAQGPSHPWGFEGTKERIEAAGIYTIDLDGRDRRRVTASGRAHDYRLTWLPDEKRLVFLRGEGTFNDLWSVNIDGTDLKRLTREDDVVDYAVAPDGRTLAWASRSGIHAGPAAGGKSQLLTTQSAYSLDWSPDGQRIVFSADTIYVLNLATGDVDRLSSKGNIDKEPDWRPSRTSAGYDQPSADERGDDGD